jgi:hypothetical protein
MKIVAVIGICFLASGCTLFQENAEDIGKAAGEVVKAYCDNVTIPEVRDEIRAFINKYAEPNSVSVTCASPVPVITTE